MSNRIFHTEPKKDNTEVVQVQQENKLTLGGHHKPHKGHKVWEFNTVTNEIQEAEMEILPTPFARKTKALIGVYEEEIPIGVRKKLIVKENCRYESALNIKNALKKFGINAKIVKLKNK